MLLAKNIHGDMIEATQTEDGYCPYCDAEMQHKCGKIVVWHWAHKEHNKNCIYKPETDWHRHLKKQAILCGGSVEVIYGKHIADIVFGGSHVIELQHSSISPNDITSRSEYHTYHGRLIDWIFDMREKHNLEQLVFSAHTGFTTFKQKWKKKTIKTLFDINGYPIYGAVYFDIGLPRCMFNVQKLYESGGGWGYFIKNKPFVFGKNHYLVSEV